VYSVNDGTERAGLYVTPLPGGVARPLDGGAHDGGGSGDALDGGGSVDAPQESAPEGGADAAVDADADADVDTPAPDGADGDAGD
jgi:hypothetical protein